MFIFLDIGVDGPGNMYHILIPCLPHLNQGRWFAIETALLVCVLKCVKHMSHITYTNHCAIR